jgi:RNA polymerase sigma factor (sigma-70 family)
MGEKEALIMIRQRRNIDVAFAVLVELYKDWLRGYLFSLCHNPDDADELEQRTFVAAFKGIFGFNPERGSFSTWLRRIGERRWVDMCRERYRGEKALAEFARCSPLSAGGPDEDMVRRAREEEAWRRLRRLDLCDAFAAILHWMEDKSYEEMSVELRIPVGAAKARALRAMHQLRVQEAVDPVPRPCAGEEECDGRDSDRGILEGDA